MDDKSAFELINKVIGDPNVLRNILIHMSTQEVLKMSKTKGYEIITDILNDQSYWKERLKFHNPDVYNALISSNPSYQDWEKAVKYTEYYTKNNDKFFGAYSLNEDSESVQIRAALINAGVIPLNVVIDTLKDSIIDANLVDVYQEILVLFHKNPKEFLDTPYASTLMKYAVILCDINAAKTLIPLISEIMRVDTLNYVQCAEILEIYVPHIDKNILMIPLIKSARSVEEFQSFVDRHQLTINTRMLYLAAGLNPIIFDYLVNFNGFDRFSQTKHGDFMIEAAVQGGQYELLKDFLTYQETFDYLGHNDNGVKLLKLAFSIPTYFNHFFKFVFMNEYVDFVKNRIECIKILIRIPKCDRIKNGASLIADLNSDSRHGLSMMGKKTIERLESYLSELLSLLIHRLDFDIMKKLDKLISGQFLPIFENTVIALDSRINLDTLESLVVKKWERSIAGKWLNFITNARQRRQIMKLSIRNIHPINSLTRIEKLQAMITLDTNNELDAITSNLVRNQKFRDAYIMSDEILASTLNKMKIPLVDHLNTAAAAALIANDVDAFNLLTPYSTQSIYRQYFH